MTTLDSANSAMASLKAAQTDLQKVIDDLSATPPQPTPTPTAFGIGLCLYKSTDFNIVKGIGITKGRMDNPSAATITAAASAGIEVLPICCYNPWTDTRPTGATSDKYLPDTDAKRTLWAQRMVAQWAGMASPPTKFECWNEPWLTSFSQPAPDAASYLALCKALAKELWAKWPKAILIVSADTSGSGGYPWRANLLKADTGGFLNDTRIRPSTHNYVEGRTPTQVTTQPCSWDLDRYKCAYNDFKAHGHPDPQVHITEYGWVSNTAGGTGASQVTEQQQADYHVQAIGIFRKSGMVASCYSFMLKTGDNWNYNWLRPDGSQKPVCAAVKAIA